MQIIKIIQTEDGSHSLYLPQLKETYHSFHGAVTESIYVYVHQGLNFLLQQKAFKELNILEVGFGTGLNILLTIAEAQESRVKISITTLEPFPLSEEIIKGLNYHTLLSKQNPSFDYSKYFNIIHAVRWNESVKVNEHVELNKRQINLQELDGQEEAFDLVYFDAFAPSKQPELWCQEIFQQLFYNMKKGGVIVTYCAQGQFKRNLKAAGFDVQTLQGPPGKKEMVRAIKPV